MSFERDLKQFLIKVESRVPAVALSVAVKAHASIKEGSPVTGAPGQPVDTGFLRNSWIIEPGRVQHVIRTNAEYAPRIEDGISESGSPMRLRSAVGGFHSVKLTIAGASALQAEALRELGE